MNLRQLESFLRVAELGSFSKAARVLDIAQPALSRQVRALETDLHASLLLRNGRGVELTDAGKRLFEHGVAILQQVAQASQDVSAERDTPAGRITIGLPPSIGRQLTRPLIEGFARSLPRARLAIVEGLTADIAEWIAGGRVDLGLLYNPQPLAALEIEPILREPLCLVQLAQGRQRRGRPLPLAELAKYPLVMPEPGQSIRRLVEGQAVLAGLRLNVAWEVSSIASIIDLVCAGIGSAVLTAGAVSASGRAGSLIVRRLTEPDLISVLCRARPANKPPTPLTQRVTDLLTALVKALPKPREADVAIA